MVRDSFIFYKEWFDALSDLPGEIRLEVYEAAIMYATMGKIPELKSMANLAFNFIKKSIDRNQEKYQEVKNKKSVGGRKGNLKKYHEDIYNMVEAGELTLAEGEKIAKCRIAKKNIGVVADNVNVNDSVNVHDNVLKEKNKKENRIVKIQNTKGETKLLHPNLLKTLQILQNDTIWIESICINNGINKLEIKDLLIAFFAKLQDEEVFSKEEQDAKQHFSRWVKLRDTKLKTDKKVQTVSNETDLHPLLRH